MIPHHADPATEYRLSVASLLSDLGLVAEARSLVAELAASDAFAAALALAVIDLGAGETERAAAGFERAAGLRPGSADAALGRGLAELQAGRHAAASDALCLARMLGADEAATALGIGEAALAQGDLALARAELERSLAARPESVAPRLALARCLRASCDDRQAIVVLSDGLVHAPLDARLLLALAGVLEATGDGAGARAVVSFPARELASDDPDLIHAWAVLALRGGELDEARVAIARLEAAVQPTPEACLELAKLCLVARDHAAADRHLTICLAAMPDAAEAHYLRALLDAPHDAEAARRELALALALEPGHWHAALVWAELALAGGDDATASALVEHAERRAGPVPEVVALRRSIRRHGEARAAARATRTTTPDDEGTSFR
ncbi:MAG: tetratricopeptide repeat protein [Deltaproteobacteria bacterium]|nr:tetratricopeptide repeat protein [Deltaproteobacteria bacterium]